MKLKNLFLAVIAAGAALVGCDQEDFGEAVFEVSSETEIAIPKEGGFKTFTLKSTLPWCIRGVDKAADWLDVQVDGESITSSKKKIAASAKEHEVVVSALMRNTKKNRSVDLVLFADIMHRFYLTVGQEGDLGMSNGTKQYPYTTSEALELINAGKIPAENVYVKGVIHKVNEINTSFGNATYLISDDGSEKDTLTVYRGYGLGGDKLKSETALAVGDSVTVYGKLKLHYGTPEFDTGSKIYRLNDQIAEVESSSEISGTPAGDGTVESPYNVAKALTLIADNQIPAGEVYISGTISSIDEVNTNFGNATYFISDDGTTTSSQLEVYRGFGLGGQKFTAASELAVGDEVVVFGKLKLYNSTSEVDTGSSIYSLNGQTYQPEGPVGTPEGDGKLETPYNVAGAQQLIGTLEKNGITPDSVYVTGKIVSIEEVNTTNYGSAKFYISDDGTKAGQLYIFGCYFLGKEKFVSPDQIAVGDEVLLYGLLKNHNGNTPEMTSGGYIVKLNGSSDPGKYLSVSTDAITVGAAAGTKTFSVISNVAWTATSDNEAFVLSDASGSGDKEITITFEENTGEERTATITVSTEEAVHTASFTIQVRQLAAGAAEATKITWEKAADWTVNDSDKSISYTSGVYTIVVKKNGGSTTPTINSTANDCRAYAKATIEITSSAGNMSRIVFNISAQGLKRLAPITADPGTVAAQATGDKTVTWEGSAEKVVFTVGDKADYGSEGSEKAGQLDFDSIEIE